MKINFDIECTPEEARAFLGLPDVKPMQEKMMGEIEERMRSNLGSMEPEALLKTWMPVGVQGLEQLQKMFWAQMGQGKTDETSKK